MYKIKILVIFFFFASCENNKTNKIYSLENIKFNEFIKIQFNLNKNVTINLDSLESIGEAKSYEKLNLRFIKFTTKHPYFYIIIQDKTENNFYVEYFSEDNEKIYVIPDFFNNHKVPKSVYVENYFFNGDGFKQILNKYFSDTLISPNDFYELMINYESTFYNQDVNLKKMSKNDLFDYYNQKDSICIEEFNDLFREQINYTLSKIGEPYFFAIKTPKNDIIKLIELKYHHVELPPVEYESNYKYLVKIFTIEPCL